MRTAVEAGQACASAKESAHAQTRLRRRVRECVRVSRQDTEAQKTGL